MPLSTDDRLAIHELVALHGHLMDDGAFDRLSELFTDDFAYDVTAYGFGVLRGYAAFAEAARTLGDGNPLGHHVTNIVVSEDADGTVRVRSKGLGVPVDGPVGGGLRGRGPSGRGAASGRDSRCAAAGGGLAAQLPEGGPASSTVASRGAESVPPGVRSAARDVPSVPADRAARAAASTSGSAHPAA